MSGSRVRVLIVDDEPPILAATRDLLVEYDFDVETHGDAATIVERLREVAPAVLLQDVRMPGLDVRELVARVREDDATKGTRVVLFSAGIEAEEIGRELGLEVVRKPFKPQQLLAALRAS